MKRYRLLPVLLSFIAASCVQAVSSSEREPVPTPTLPPAVVSAAISVCRDASLKLDLPPQAAGDCVEGFEWYMENETRGEWPGPKATRTNPDISQAFQLATNVVTGWGKAGYLPYVRAEDARRTLMDFMGVQREQIQLAK